jgi:hypothetical protein
LHLGRALEVAGGITAGTQQILEGGFELVDRWSGSEFPLLIQSSAKAADETVNLSSSCGLVDGLHVAAIPTAVYTRSNLLLHDNLYPAVNLHLSRRSSI